MTIPHWTNDNDPPLTSEDDQTLTSEDDQTLTSEDDQTLTSDDDLTHQWWRSHSPVMTIPLTNDDDPTLTSDTYPTFTSEDDPTHRWKQSSWDGQAFAPQTECMWSSPSGAWPAWREPTGEIKESQKLLKEQFAHIFCA